MEVNKEMSENEFELHKQELKSNVKHYLEIDDQIKALTKALGERRKQKKKLADSILETMKHFEIDNMNTKNGRLIYSSKKSVKPLNKKNLLSGLTLYFKNDGEKAKEVSSIVLENRETVEKITLRRTINKNANNFSLV